MKKYRVVLWLVESGCGLTTEQVMEIVSRLEEDAAGYLPIEIEGETNSVAIGFVGASYYEELDYDCSIFEETIVPVLEDWALETETREYELKDGETIYMGCDYEAEFIHIFDKCVKMLQQK